MFNLPGKKRSEYLPNELARLEPILEDYRENSRSLESDTATDLEKHLWLANGAAATLSIGFVQASNAVTLWQNAGCWSFISGIFCLVILKYLSATLSSRDRFRSQDAKSRFDANEVTAQVLREIRDRTFRVMKRAYLVLQWGAGFAFITGLILTLVGVQHAA